MAVSEVVLNAGLESVTVPSAIASGKSVRELFGLYAEQLGINPNGNLSFRRRGTTIDGTTLVEGGDVISAGIQSESKG